MLDKWIEYLLFCAGGLVWTLVAPSSFCVSLLSIVLFREFTTCPSSVLSKKPDPCHLGGISLACQEREGHNSNSHMYELVVSDPETRSEGRNGDSWVCVTKGTNLFWGLRLGKVFLVAESCLEWSSSSQKGSWEIEITVGFEVMRRIFIT